MYSPIDELKIQAKRRLKTLEPIASNRHSQRPVTLKHCQLLIARQHGFSDWQHARDILACRPFEPGTNYGHFWHTSSCSTLLNRWCRNYSEAQQVQQQYGGTLLPYQQQFIVVESEYLATLGLNHHESLWQQINHNWCEGAPEIRQQLALLLLKFAATKAA